MSVFGRIIGKLILLVFLSASLLMGCRGEVSQISPEPVITIPSGTEPISPSETASSTSPPIQDKPIQVTPGQQPEFIQLTNGGCCAYPEWSEDSNYVLYLDKPEDSEDAAWYRINIQYRSIEKHSEEYTIVSTGSIYHAAPRGEQVLIERQSDGARWLLYTSGSQILFSPDLRHVAWEVGANGVAHLDRIKRSVWVSTIDGENSRELVQTIGGRIQDWALGGSVLVVSGRLSEDGPSGLWKINIEEGSTELIVESEKPRSVSISPNGRWLAYIEAFNSNPSLDGMWLINIESLEARPIDIFGGYRWRSQDQLVIIPMDFESSSQYLTQYNVTRDELQRLTEPDLLNPFEVANNDWQISPNGQYMVMRSAMDGNLWLMELPNPDNSP